MGKSFEHHSRCHIQGLPCSFQQTLRPQRSWHLSISKKWNTILKTCSWACNNVSWAQKVLGGRHSASYGSERNLLLHQATIHNTHNWGDILLFYVKFFLRMNKIATCEHTTFPYKRIQLKLVTYVSASFYMCTGYHMLHSREWDVSY